MLRELLGLSRPARRWIVLAAVLVAANTAVIVVFGLLAGVSVAGIVTGDATYFGALVAVAIGRGMVAWAQRRLSTAASTRIIGDLRRRSLAQLAHSDPRRVDRAWWRATLGPGLDGLMPYLTGFLPAALSNVVTIPVTLIVLWLLDPTTAVIVAVTIPLIPVFMWLIGTLTRDRTERRLRDLGLLSDQLLDLAAGRPTLHALHADELPVAEIDRLSNAHRRSSLRVLRIAFLSSFMLEFLATLSVAMVAVGIGFRLLDGELTLTAGLAALIIAPEAYNPLREVGRRFHDANDGLEAARAVLTLLSSEPPAPPEPTAGQLAGGPITVEFHNLTATAREGNAPDRLTGTARPGELTVLQGANGSGKSTSLLALLGVATDGITGAATARAQDEVLSGPALWQRTRYLPQRPDLTPDQATDASGLSLGQRQLAAIDLNGDLVLLDEPTAHLDEKAAAALIQKLRTAAGQGRTVLVASHDPLVVAAADHVIEVSA